MYEVTIGCACRALSSTRYSIAPKTSRWMSRSLPVPERTGSVERPREHGTELEHQNARMTTGYQSLQTLLIGDQDQRVDAWDSRCVIGLGRTSR
jgi:hypothetical protein